MSQADKKSPDQYYYAIRKEQAKELDRIKIQTQTTRNRAERRRKETILVINGNVSKRKILTVSKILLSEVEDFKLFHKNRNCSRSLKKCFK